MTKSKKTTFWILTGAAVAALCVTLPGLMMVLSMIVPPSKEDVIAQNAHEENVKPVELGVNGTLMVDEGRDLIAIDVATNKKFFTYSHKRDENTFALAGPNELGTVVVLVNNMMAERHKLMMINLNTSQVTTIFENKGDALWDDAVGNHIAIAAHKDVAIFFKGTGHKQFFDPQAYMSSGTINRIDLHTKKIEVLTQEGLDDFMTLSADGGKAWYLTPYPRAMAKNLPGGHLFPPSSSEAPCMVMWENGLKTPVAAGFGGVVSNSEGFASVGEYEGSEQILNLKTKKLESTTFPNYAYGIRSIPLDNVFIAWAKQTKVEDVEFTTANGMPGPRSLLRIAAFEADSDRVATLYPRLDPRREWSYGPWSQSR